MKPESNRIFHSRPLDVLKICLAQTLLLFTVGTTAATSSAVNSTAASGTSSTTNPTANSTTNPTTSSAFTILIDPGHGGSDTGARRGSVKESEIALRVSQMLAELLRKDPAFKVAMTRDRDEKLTLEQRAQKAKEIKPDLFISVHLNSSADPRAHGREFYFQNQLPADEEAMFIVSRENAEGEPSENAAASGDRLSSETDVKRILEDLKRNHRIRASSELSKDLLEAWLADGQSRRIGSLPIRQAPFYVVSNVPSPSVLVELGFLTHATEGPRLAQTEYQELLARSIYEGLVKYKESVDKGHGALIQSAQQPDPKADKTHAEVLREPAQVQ